MKAINHDDRPIRSTGNVFEDAGYPKDEAANLLIRTKLMIAIRRYIKENGLRQIDAAEHFGVTRPEISLIQNKKIRDFSIDRLVNMLSRIGVQVNLNLNPAAPVESESHRKVAVRNAG